jgi:L-arabinose isomerase
MIQLEKYEAWFVTGSQHLYGEETLGQVAEHVQIITDDFNQSPDIPVRVICKPVMTTPDAILKLCLEANATTDCIGLITWMHTFSPAKMWINGLNILHKPFVHLHTQFNRDIPWSEIDMDFMNLNQSAHGGREFGHICTRLGKSREVIVGHWESDQIKNKLAVWMRAACAWQDAQSGKIARFGDNMRDVAVTEGDKVEAQLKFGYSVYGYGVGDLVEQVKQVDDSAIEKLIEEYKSIYEISPKIQKNESHQQTIREAARIELGLRKFLSEGNFKAFTTTFEDLHGLKQLPGLAVQRLMADGYGFGAEGDWKAAALLRAMKVMSAGMPGGTSFMEDYTYHFDPQEMRVLGAHMLEICPSIASEKPHLEIFPLSIGGKADPARLIFNVGESDGINASLIDLGNRFRMIVNEVAVVNAPQPMPKLPVARVLWAPKPDLEIAATCWILAGGAHHTGFSQAVTTQHIEDFAEMADIEFLLINDDTRVNEFKKELRWNSAYYFNKSGTY